MVSQPETLKFGPQWIRKLSDCAFPTQRSSSTNEKMLSLDETLADCRLFSSPDFNTAQCDYQAEDCGNCESGNWLPDRLDSVEGDSQSLRSEKHVEDSHKSGISPGTHPHHSNADTDQLVEHSVDTLVWNKFTPPSVSEHKWHRHSDDDGSPRVSTSPMMSKWKSLNPGALDAALTVDNPEDSFTGAQCVGTMATTTGKCTISTTRDPSLCKTGDVTVTGPSLETSFTNQTSRVDVSVSFVSNLLDSTPESSFVTSLSKSLNNCQTKGAVCTYFNVQSEEKHPSTDTSMTPTSLWVQHQHFWSRSVPHQLQSFEPLDSVAASLPLLLNQTAICDTLDIGKSFVLSDSISALDCKSAFNPSHSRLSTNSVPESERRFHCPDGADQPDEHLWLYEDPQGRTQGSFSDAQMNDWLSAGIYFTPVLRIRRKCDTTFSTLADYTGLFGRIPFTPGPRVPPIHGGITPSILSSAPNPSTLLGSMEHVSIGQNFSESNNFGLLQSSGACCSTLDSTLQNSESRPAMHPSHRTAHHTLDFPTVFNQNLTVSDPKPHLAVSDGDRFQSLKTGTSGVCANSDFFVPQSHQTTHQSNVLTHCLPVLNVAHQPCSNPDITSTATSGPLSTSASTFMALASLISVNPALASLALSFSGQSRAGNRVNLSSEALAPGFLAALAQYLNVQPQISGHQTASPMQQLAETAQLAAQLAAMASVHNPIEPAQALALAELVRSQAHPPSSSQWFPYSKQDIVTDGNHYDPNVESVDRRCHQTATEDCAGRSFVSGRTSCGTLGDEGHLDSLSHWPSLSASGSTSGARSVPRAGDARRLPKTSASVNIVAPMDHVHPIGFPPQQYTMSQVSSPTQPIGPRSAPSNVQSPNDVGSGCVSTHVGETSHPLEVWPSSGLDVARGGLCGNTSGQPATGAVNTTSSSRYAPPTGHWVNKVKQTPSKPVTQGGSCITSPNGLGSQMPSGVSSNATAKSSGKNTSHMKITADEAKSTAKSTNNPRSSLISMTNNSQSVVYGSKLTTATMVVDQFCSSLSESNRTIEDELASLTQWCQTRLGSMPMREKVDIPTVVELLATLDAPYEVERMVQTFLGESTRASLFVKEFLDQRRPFWKLHRERRDNECLAKSPSQSNKLNGNAHRSTDKKKRSGGCHDSIVQNVHRSDPNRNVQGSSGSSWTKMCSTHSTHTDQSQDNQWHHIKSKVNHNRKAKKDKAS